MNFRQVIEEYGYPLISKEISQTIYECRSYMRHHDGSPEGFYRWENLNGTRIDKSGELSRYNNTKWKFLIDSPFKISHKCCSVMKKTPAKEYAKKTGRQAMTAQMACESQLRTTQWILHGCNAFDQKRPISNPMSFWTEQDVLAYIHQNKIEIAAPYGEVIVRNETGIDGQTCIADLLGDFRDCVYDTTKAKRTGCIFCMFGISQDKERFARLAKEEPKLYDYVMRGGEFVGEWWQPDGKGLGYWFVIQWLNKFGGLDIVAPGLEEYEKQYGNERTKKEMEAA